MTGDLEPSSPTSARVSSFSYQNIWCVCVYIYVCVHICACMCTCVCRYPQTLGEDVGSPGIGVIGMVSYLVWVD